MPTARNPLTDDDRERIIDTLRDEAIEQCRQMGCTCQPEPKLELTDRGFGRYGLPAWMSEHPDDCPAALLAADPRGTTDGG